jgi:hypothetical protein
LFFRILSFGYCLILRAHVEGSKFDPDGIIEDAFRQWYRSREP